MLTTLLLTKLLYKELSLFSLQVMLMFDTHFDENTDDEHHVAFLLMHTARGATTNLREKLSWAI